MFRESSRGTVSASTGYAVGVWSGGVYSTTVNPDFMIAQTARTDSPFDLSAYSASSALDTINVYYQNT